MVLLLDLSWPTVMVSLQLADRSLHPNLIQPKGRSCQLSDTTSNASKDQYMNESFIYEEYVCMRNI